MAKLKYSVIKGKQQYDAYCSALETLLERDPANSEEVELLTLLIEHYDVAHTRFADLDPVELPKSFMHEK